MSDGTGSVYRRGNVWWIDYSFRGKRHRESSGSTKKKDATALLRKRMKEMGEGGPMVDEEKLTIEDLKEAIVTDYEVNGKKSLPRMKRAFQHVQDYFTDWRAVDITTGRVKRYIVARQDEGAANATINKELAALRRAFNLLKEEDQISRVPHIPTLSTDNVRKDFLTMGDVEAICAEISADLAPVVRFAAYTGWRKGEVLDMRWRQVDFDAGMVHLDPGTTKNKEGRTFPISALPPLEKLLRRQKARTEKVEKRTDRLVPWVFHRNGREIKSMRGAWNGATKRAGLDGAWFHDLRRTAVKNLEDAGVPRSVATKLTGHKTESVYRRYAIADEDALKEGVEKLAKLHQDGPEENRSVVSLDEAREA